MQFPYRSCSPLPCLFSSPFFVPLRSSLIFYSSFILLLSHISPGEALSKRVWLSILVLWPNKEELDEEEEEQEQEQDVLWILGHSQGNRLSEGFPNRDLENKAK